MDPTIRGRPAPRQGPRRLGRVARGAVAAHARRRRPCHGGAARRDAADGLARQPTWVPSAIR
jgi:hypothetical protein